MALCIENGGASTNLGLKDLQVQEKEGRTDPRSGPGRPSWADRPKPIPARFDRPSLTWVLMYLCTLPLHLHYFDDVILASKLEVFLA
jgi:hypothetical protein